MRDALHQTFALWVQNLLLAATLLAAVWIGWLQNRINTTLLDLNFVPSVEITFDQHDWRYHNAATANVWVTGVVCNGIIDPMTDAVLLPVGSVSSTRGVAFEEYIKNAIGDDGKAEWPMDVHLRSASDKKYILKLRLLVEVKGGTPSVRVQPQALTPTDSLPPRRK